MKLDNQLWLRALPEWTRNDPDVVVVLAPEDATWQVVESLDGRITFGLMRLAHTGEQLGLQVLRPDVGPREEHVHVMAAAGYKMAPVVYFGALSGIPQSVLMSSGMCPLVFLRDAMHRQFWNLKRFFRKPEGEAVWN
jgi:hypothetical protein